MSAFSIKESLRRGSDASMEYAEGKQAAIAGLSFRNDCPYTFDRAKCSVAEFDAKWRGRMDGWFAGWQEERDRKRLAYPASSKTGGTP